MNAEITNPNRKPAHILWVELTTRITTQKLHYRSGDEEAAAESVYKLYDKTRGLMEQHLDAALFQSLSLNLLNNTLRPYSARWHRWMTAIKPMPGEPGKLLPVFKDEQVRRLFRGELADLKQELSVYLLALKALAEGSEIPEETQKTIDGFGDGTAKAQLGKTLDAEWPQALESMGEKEHEEILLRRQELVAPLPEKPLRNAAGLALSGGGIRSATYCLGIVQTLARKDLFHQFDYLSTVSGGGYLGTFLSSLLADKSKQDESQPGPNQTAKEMIDEILKTPSNGSESKAVRHLRNNSKYLGAGGIPRMAGVMVFGIFTNLLLLLPAPLFVALCVYQLNQWGFWDAPAEFTSMWFGLLPSRWGHCLRFELVALLALVFVLPFIQSATHGQHSGKWAKLRSVWENTTLYLAVLTLITGVFYSLPEVFKFYIDLKAKITAVWPMVVTGVMPFLLAYGAKMLIAWKRAQKFVLGLFVLSGPLFFLVVFLEAGIRLGLDASEPLVDPSRIFAIAVLLLIWGWFLVNINTLSPHRYYRNRLCDCYLLENNTGALSARTDMPLAELGGAKRAAPYHLINTTVNLTTSQNPELRGRNGDFFVLSKHFSGSQVTGYHPTEKVVGNNPHIDLGSAMAISGAAASTGMGWQTITNFRFLMGLMNIRLGYWLRNPTKKIHCKLLEGPGPWYLYKEIFGWMKETDRYLNLSDGGHIENLAVYELLRRKCKFIVCVDGGQEAGMECADLVRLQRYAEIDLGIRMEYDIGDLQFDENRLSRAYAVLVKIIYAGPEDECNPDWANAELGWMLYIKLAMTGSEPAYVTDYRRTNPTFPHQTTADQFFDEAQFEAYRMLGECAAESLFRRELVGDFQPDDLQAWFQALADHLLPDNDEVFVR